MTPSSIELRELRLLAALVAEKSVSRAASRVGLSQPAASNALARLRRSLGDPIFVRSGRGIALTPRVLALGAMLGRTLEEIDGTFAGTKRFDPATSSQTFTIAATDFGEFVLLAPLLRVLSREAPRVAVRVVPLGARFPADELESGGIDLVIGSFREAPPRLYRKPLFREASISLVRRGHPLASRKLTFKQFADLGHVLVAPRGETSGLIDEVLADKGLSRRIVASVPHFLAAAFLVEETDFIVTLAERVARRFAEMLALAPAIPPVPLPSVTIAALWHERTLRDPAHRWLRSTLGAVAREV